MILKRLKYKTYRDTHGIRRYKKLKNKINKEAKCSREKRLEEKCQEVKPFFRNNRMDQTFNIIKKFFKEKTKLNCKIKEHR